MRHETLDLDEWNNRLSSIPSDLYLPAILNSHSPFSLVAIERLREKAKRKGELGQSVPVDCFTLGTGHDKQHFSLTKFGGCPHRPVETPWPKDQDNQPYQFVLQICFNDSLDILPELPGELLLIYMRVIESFSLLSEKSHALYLDRSDSMESDLYFEWQSKTISELMKPEQAPICLDPQPLFHGVRHRSVDYKTITGFEKMYQEATSGLELPVEEAGLCETYRMISCFPQLKIGGFPYWDKNADIPYEGIPLASFSSFYPLLMHPFPWVNQELEQDMLTYMESGLSIGGEPRINLFLQKDGSVKYIAQFS
jgi:hypothetical protein